MRGMPFTTHTTFKNMDSSAALETRAQELAAKLDHFYDGIMRCDVLIDQPHKKQSQGRPFHVRIHLHLRAPGADVIVSHDPGDDNAHYDPYVTLRDAFDAAKRQLQTVADRLHGDVKKHSTPAAPPPQVVPISTEH